MFSVVFCTLFPCGYTAGGCTPYNPLCHCQWLSGIRRLRHQNTFESPFRGHLWYPHGRMVKRIDEMNLKCGLVKLWIHNKKEQLPTYIFYDSFPSFEPLQTLKLSSELGSWLQFWVSEKIYFYKETLRLFFRKILTCIIDIVYTKASSSMKKIVDAVNGATSSIQHFIDILNKI